jgi:ribosome-binding factor A
MSHRMLQVNELLKGELALLVQEEVPLENGLITISNVKCSADLKNAIVSISVIPENQSGTALKNVRKNSRFFSNTLRKKLNLKFIPNFKWKIDSQIRYANDLNEMISSIKS